MVDDLDLLELEAQEPLVAAGKGLLGLDAGDLLGRGAGGVLDLFLGLLGGGGAGGKVVARAKEDGGADTKETSGVAAAAIFLGLAGGCQFRLRGIAADLEALRGGLLISFWLSVLLC